MSNRATIKQETTIAYKSKDETKSVCIFDNYGEGSICLDDYCDTFYEDDLELLMFVLETVKTPGFTIIHAVLDFVFEHENGMYIDDTWYNWEQIQPVFKKAGY